MGSTPTNASVLVIGASRGRGHAIAAEYLARGSQVVATVRGSGRTALSPMRIIEALGHLTDRRA